MKRSTNVIVSNLSRDNILFSTFYIGLFLLFKKKNGGGRAPPAPPLATALSLIWDVILSDFYKGVLYDDGFFVQEYIFVLPWTPSEYLS